jgi:hypothetical protein
LVFLFDFNIVCFGRESLIVEGGGRIGECHLEWWYLDSELLIAYIGSLSEKGMNGIWSVPVDGHRNWGQY